MKITASIAGNPMNANNMSPKYLYRSSDGQRFSLQPNGKYTMDDSQMVPKYEYPPAALPAPDFVDSKEKCVLEVHTRHTDGHGDEEFDE